MAGRAAAAVMREVLGIVFVPEKDRAFVWSRDVGRIIVARESTADERIHNIMSRTYQGGKWVRMDIKRKNFSEECPWEASYAKLITPKLVIHKYEQDEFEVTGYGRVVELDEENGTGIIWSEELGRVRLDLEVATDSRGNRFSAQDMQIYRVVEVTVEPEPSTRRDRDIHWRATKLSLDVEQQYLENVPPIRTLQASFVPPQPTAEPTGLEEFGVVIYAVGDGDAIFLTPFDYYRDDYANKQFTAEISDRVDFEVLVVPAFPNTMPHKWRAIWAKPLVEYGSTVSTTVEVDVCDVPETGAQRVQTPPVGANEELRREYELSEPGRINREEEEAPWESAVSDQEMDNGEEEDSRWNSALQRLRRDMDEEEQVGNQRGRGDGEGREPSAEEHASFMKRVARSLLSSVTEQRQNQMAESSGRQEFRADSASPYVDAMDYMPSSASDSDNTDSQVQADTGFRTSVMQQPAFPPMQPRGYFDGQTARLRASSFIQPQPSVRATRSPFQAPPPSFAPPSVVQEDVPSMSQPRPVPREPVVKLEATTQTEGFTETEFLNEILDDVVILAELGQRYPQLVRSFMKARGF